MEGHCTLSQVHELHSYWVRLKVVVVVVVVRCCSSRPVPVTRHSGRVIGSRLDVCATLKAIVCPPLSIAATVAYSPDIVADRIATFCV